MNARIENDAARGKLRIALLSPKGPLYRKHGGIFKQSLRYMPLTLPTLVSLIPQELDAEVVCYDEGIDTIPARLEAELVGITVITGTARRAYELAAQYRREGKTVVLGGPHVTLQPDEAQAQADSIVVGYAEDEWPRLLRDHVNGSLRPRYTQAPDFELGGYPLPQRGVLPRFKYLTHHVFEATRSCIFACEFCVAPSAWGSRPLQKPVDEIVADMRRLKTRRAIFVDLNLTSDRDYALALFAALKPLGIQWFGLSTTLICRDEVLLDAAAESGCRGLLMGLESINRKNLKSVRKGFNQPDDYAEVVAKLHQRNIALQGCFVFGLDDDEPDIFEKTAQFAIDARIDLPRFAIATPFPGTPFYQRLLAQHRIIDFDWEHYDGQHAVFQPQNMSVEELQTGTSLAWKKAYAFGAIATRLRSSAAPPHIALLTNLGYRYYAYRLERFYNCAWPAALVGAGSD